jgi:hypothetical protein
MVPGVTQDLLPEGFQLRRVPQRLMIGQLYKVEYRDNGGDLCEWCKRNRAPCGCFKRFSGSAMLGPHRRGRRGVGDGQP